MVVGKIKLNVDLVKQMSKSAFVKMFGDRIDNAEEVYFKINPPKKKKKEED
jgi:hypothetical protein